MIYLVKSACFKDVNDVNCTEYETILKIGYTRDDRASIRLATYRTENPGAISLYSIPEGDEQDERNKDHYNLLKELRRINKGECNIVGLLREAYDNPENLTHSW